MAHLGSIASMTRQTQGQAALEHAARGATTCLLHDEGHGKALPIKQQKRRGDFHADEMNLIIMEVVGVLESKNWDLSCRKINWDLT